MPLTTPAFRTLWVRALVVPSLLLVLTAVFLLLSVGTATSGASLGPAADQSTSWRTSYSQRFPACVALVLWPRAALPKALLVQDAHGVRTLPLREGMARLRDARPADRTEIVGACR